MLRSPWGDARNKGDLSNEKILYSNIVCAGVDNRKGRQISKTPADLKGWEACVRNAHNIPIISYRLYMTFFNRCICMYIHMYVRYIASSILICTNLF
jgi:hypothetical protein